MIKETRSRTSVPRQRVQGAQNVNCSLSTEQVDNVLPNLVGNVYTAVCMQIKPSLVVWFDNICRKPAMKKIVFSTDGGPLSFSV